LETLGKMGGDIDAAAAGALRAGAEVLLGGMYERVPVDKGNLRDHLRVAQPARDGNTHSVMVGVIGADAETARYAHAQEYGTSSMPAQPYVRPAVDTLKGKARQAMIAHLAQEIEVRK
jgi:HK97 gp10 family phage protein